MQVRTLLDEQSCDRYFVFPRFREAGELGEKKRRMRKVSSISAQINYIVQESGRVEIGSTTTRHEQVQAAREAGYTKPEDVAKRTSITKSNTYEKYKAEWKAFGQWQRQHPEVCGEHPMIKTMTPDQVGAYLQDLSARVGSYETFNLACKGLNKLDGMIQDATRGKFAPNIGQTIKMWREIGRETLPGGGREHAPRAFVDPQAVIGCLRNDRNELAAEIQLRTGLRAGDVCTMTLNPDGKTFFINSKCGNRFPCYQLPADLTERVKALAPQYGQVQENGSCKISVVSSYKSYLRDIAQSCKACGETYSGSHSLRYNFARALFLELRAQGMDIDHAKAKVSEALFHHRIDITERYLAGLV